MRKKTPAGPCRILNAEQRPEVEKQMRDAGRLRTVSEVELERMRKRKSIMVEAGSKDQSSKALEAIRGASDPAGVVPGAGSDFRAMWGHLWPTLSFPTEVRSQDVDRSLNDDTTTGIGPARRASRAQAADGPRNRSRHRRPAPRSATERHRSRPLVRDLLDRVGEEPGLAAAILDDGEPRPAPIPGCGRIDDRRTWPDISSDLARA
jgi:hypothetical protein